MILDDGHTGPGDHFEGINWLVVHQLGRNLEKLPETTRGHVTDWWMLSFVSHDFIL